MFIILPFKVINNIYNKSLFFDLKMFEIVIHGRGGQGAVTSGQILAKAFFYEGKYVQSFPEFGVERTGAPVKAFVRVDDKPILLRQRVYDPDYVIILDSTLIDAVRILDGIKKGAKVIINSTKKYNFKDFDVFSFDATAIALEIFGSNIVNTAILAVFAYYTKLLKIESIIRAIEEHFDKEDIRRKNIDVVEKIYELLTKTQNG